MSNAIGRHRHDLTTPALLLDLDVAQRNIATMAAKFRELPANLRPHIKVHKSPDLARLEVAAGAVGVACATVWEALVMVDGGIADVLVANQVVGPEKIETLVELAERARITVAVDDPRNVAALGEAATARGVTLEVLVEIDVGMERCGVRTPAEAAALAAVVAGTPGLELRGFQGYEGHCMLEPDPDVRRRLAGEANAKLIAAGDLAIAAGLEVADLSGGGTGTYFITGANPRITEVQAGSYTLMDNFHGNLVPGGFERALTVLSTVISRQGDAVIFDAGRKAIGVDHVAPTLRDHPDVPARFFAEEHALFDFPDGSPFDLGDRAELVPGYGPTTVNLYDEFHVIERDVVVDIWPVAARGPRRPVRRM